jgi:membrane protein YqaA with SNARE-associated domain
MFEGLKTKLHRAALSPQAEGLLALISFTESSVFPLPAEIMFLPMCLARPERALRYGIIAGLASVLGGIFGWVIGHFLFDMVALPILTFTHSLDAFAALKTHSETWFFLLLLVTSGAAHLPPMKVVTILAGVVGFNFPLFVLAALVARLGKFLLLGWALSRYGAAVAQVIKKRLALVAGIVMVLGAGLWLLTH